MSKSNSDSLTVSSFVEQVKRTDKRKETEALRMAFLGIFGELGSLMSEEKKGIREGPAYVSYLESVVEEAGDLLWYFAALAITKGWEFERLLSAALGGEFTQSSTFGEIDEFAAQLELEPNDYWLLAGEHVGILSGSVAKGMPASGDFEHATQALRFVVLALRAASICLDEVAKANVAKSQSRFPRSKTPLPLYDDRPLQDGSRTSPDERLPHFLPVEFREVTKGDKTMVVLSAFTIKLGDPLTDNIEGGDLYRFHDVFHLAYAAILGWSPVLRALLKCKRKSQPAVDENQDGARAILIEEGIASLVFNHAKPHFFADSTGVDYRLLSTIKDFVRGYEVEDQPFWAWERAILRGYEVFRELSEHKMGRVTLDLTERDIRFERLR